MLSALVIDPKKLLQDHAAVQAMEKCLSRCHWLAQAFNSKVSLSWQHNIRSDHFVILVESKKRTFGHTGLTFQAAFNKVTREIENYLKDNFDEELRPKKKSAAGKAGRQGRRRARAAGQRRHGARQG